MGPLVRWNNERMRAADAGRGNPRDLGDVAWHRELVGAYPAMREEWDAFRSRGGRLPLIEDVIGEDQGNEGPWRAGLLFSRGRACGLAPEFPRTVAALLRVPGLRSALWSELPPGTELPEHTGPNAGVLRYHLGVHCASGSALRVGRRTIPYRNGEGVLFDDTVPHAAWNRGDETRVTLFCEVERPAPLLPAMLNRGVQALISLDPRYRHAPRRAVEWHRALNRA